MAHSISGLLHAFTAYFTHFLTGNLPNNYKLNTGSFIGVVSSLQFYLSYCSDAKWHLVFEISPGPCELIKFQIASSQPNTAAQKQGRQITSNYCSFFLQCTWHSIFNKTNKIPSYPIALWLVPSLSYTEQRFSTGAHFFAPSPNPRWHLTFLVVKLRRKRMLVAEWEGPQVIKIQNVQQPLSTSPPPPNGIVKVNEIWLRMILVRQMDQEIFPCICK